MAPTGAQRNTRRKSCSSATLCTTNITWTGLKLNLRQAGDKLPEVWHGLDGQSGVSQYPVFPDIWYSVALYVSWPRPLVLMLRV
jgi:hypothetical protein